MHPVYVQAGRGLVAPLVRSSVAVKKGMRRLFSMDLGRFCSRRRSMYRIRKYMPEHVLFMHPVYVQAGRGLVAPLVRSSVAVKKGMRRLFSMDLGRFCSRR